MTSVAISGCASGIGAAIRRRHEAAGARGVTARRSRRCGVRQLLPLFVSTFTTPLAIINPFEAIPVFLKLLEGKDDFFFLIFGTLLLRVFGMTSTSRETEGRVESFVAVSFAIVATMVVTYLCLASARGLLSRIGPKGIDAATRLAGFFVASMGMGVILQGVVDALHLYGVIAR